MIRKGILIIWLLSCAMCTFAMPIYQPSQLDVIHKRGYIRVGVVKLNHPPFVIHSHHKLSGIDIDLAKEIGELLGVKVRFDQEGDYQQLMQRMYERKDDIIISALVSIPSRAKSLLFSSPYHRSQIALLLNRVHYDNLQIKQLNKLNNSKVHIGVLKASAYIGYLTYLFPKVTVVTYSTPEKILADVTSGKLDGCMLDDLFIKTWLASQPERALRTRYIVLNGYYASYGIATSYRYPVLGKWLDNFVQEAINIGYMQVLLRRYKATLEQ